MSCSTSISTVKAWDIRAGDELPDGITVISVDREATARTVRILTDEPASAELPGDSPITVIRQVL